jgi:hypothetical protein
LLGTPSLYACTRRLGEQSVFNPLLDEMVQRIVDLASARPVNHEHVGVSRLLGGF